MGDIGPVQQRYDVLPVDEPVSPPVVEPQQVDRDPRDVPERTAR